MEAITTAQLTVTQEELPGLTCSGCQAPATHTLELVMGDRQTSYAVAKRFVCDVHAVLELPILAAEANPNLWDSYRAMLVREATHRVPQGQL